jgi:hypothetical protein
VEKVLVCLLASTRAHQLTFPSFKRQVLDELNGDLALALAIDEKYDYANPFWQRAKYRWTAPDFSDVGEGFDLAQGWLCQQHNVPAPDWRSMLQIKGNWQGGIRSPDPQPSRASIQIFCRWLLLHRLQQDEVLDRYDRFVITRSDFVWLCPHPPLSILDGDSIWTPDGEQYGGVNDRHLVVSRADLLNCLNVIEDILLQPLELYEQMKYQPTWNSEQFLAHRLQRKGLLHKVKLFPYVMYLARSVRDEPLPYHESPGYYEPAVGHFIKYEKEFRSARAYATIIHGRADWEDRAWMQFEPEQAASPSASLLRRLRYACERVYYERIARPERILSALIRPGRLERFVHFCKRIFAR